MVGDDGNRVGRSLNVLAPFGESEDDREQFAVVYVIVLFGREEGSRDISAGVEVTVGISLEQDGSCGEQGGIGHD